MLDNGETVVRQAEHNFYFIFSRNPNSEAKQQTQVCKVSVPDRGVKTTMHHRLQETKREDQALPLRTLHVTQKELVP